MFEGEDAKALFKALADVDPGPGRDVLYTVARKSGESVLGQVVERTDDELLLVVEGPPSQHVEIPWGDIARLEIDVEP